MELKIKKEANAEVTALADPLPSKDPAVPSKGLKDPAASIDLKLYLKEQVDGLEKLIRKRMDEKQVLEEKRAALLVLLSPCDLDISKARDELNVLGRLKQSMVTFIDGKV